MTPLLPFTRAVYVAGFCLTVATGIGLYAVPDRTGHYWAWTIKAPLSAAFFGAGYIGAALSLLLAARSREWERTRVVAVAALTLTSLALLATVLDSGPFAFGGGGLTEVVAWIWLAVYVALPPALLVAFVLQERRGAGGRAAERAGTVTLLVFGLVGAVLAVVGLTLFVGWAWLKARWPWPLPSLPARVVGAWLCTYGAAFIWFAVKEQSWERVWIGVLPAAVSIALDLGAAARFSDDLSGGAATVLYLCVAGVLLALLVAAAGSARRAP